MGKRLWPVCRRYGVILLGAAVYALAFSWCYGPNQIGFGGVTGLAQIFHYLLPALPVGAVVMVLNVPLFLLGWRLLGGGVLAGSLVAMACSSLFIDILDALVTFPPMEPMLAAVVGGAVLGTGLGLVFAQGATTGGTDLMARLLKLRLGWLPVGKLLMGLDLVVILAVGAVFRSLLSALYGLVALTISTGVIDRILYGIDRAKVAYIISAAPEEITRAIVRELERGVTVLEGRGAWSGTEKQVLLCAFKQRQIVELKALVKSIDPAAFLIVTDAHEVLGDGFREYGKDEV